MRIKWTRGAENNLEQLKEYIAKDNPTAIETVIKIIKTIGILADNPNLGRVGRIFDTRELIISGTPYIVPYRIHKGHIELLRVLHSAMKWPEM